MKTGKIVVNHGIVDQSNQKIDDDAIKQIYASIDTLCIKKIFLYGNNISPTGIAALSLVNFDNLIHLNLGDNKIRNLGCKYLSRAPLKSCKLLSLAYNQIERAGVVHLSKAQWKSIQIIQLTGNPLSANSIKQLVRANWSTLFELYLSLSQLAFSYVLHLVQMAKPIKLLQMNGYLAERHEKEKLKKFIKQKIPNCQFYHCSD